MRFFSLLVTILVAVGCGERERNNGNRDVESAIERSGNITSGGSTTVEQASERKIIYVAEVALVVDDFAAAETAVPKLVKEFHGYLSEASISRPTGKIRSGQWTVRVPVDQFDAFLDAVTKLGVPESRRQTAQDVTEEFVDLEARINNSKRIEAEILKLLEDRTGNIKDVLEVQARLGEVRGEIERMEGRVRYLQNRTALTTVTVNIREELGYRPPEAPSFSNRLQRGWTRSLDSMRKFGENAAVFFVIAVPWLVLWAVILLPVVWFIRRRLK
jgi:hypothetical protein